MTKNVCCYQSPIGSLTIAEDDAGICEIAFGELAEGKALKNPTEDSAVTECIKDENGDLTPVLRETVRQLTEYFAGERKIFDLPLSLHGTEFQRSVWMELLKIPYGETRSYKQIAAAVGNDKASRAVGMANNRNKIPIIIPCHRVIGSNKKMVGYAGGLDKKEWLLALEQNNMK